MDDAPFSVRPKVIKLMVRLLNPKPSRSEKYQQRRLEAASAYRAFVVSLSMGWASEEDQRRAFDIMDVAGWTADENTLHAIWSLTTSLEGDAMRTDETQRLHKKLAIAQSLSLLAYQDDPEEIRIGQTVLDWIEGHRRVGRSNVENMFHSTSASSRLVQAWDEITGESQDR